MVSMDTASTGSDEAMAVSRYKSLLRAYGRREQYATPYDLLEAAVGYFEYAEMNPLQEEKVFNGKDGIVRTDVDKVRAFTKAALAHHIGWTDRKSVV